MVVDGGGVGCAGDFWKPIASLTLPATIAMESSNGIRTGVVVVVVVWFAMSLSGREEPNS